MIMGQRIKKFTKLNCNVGAGAEIGEFSPIANISGYKCTT
jgi:hypothetical protein